MLNAFVLPGRIINQMACIICLSLASATLLGFGLWVGYSFHKHLLWPARLVLCPDIFSFTRRIFQKLGHLEKKQGVYVSIIYVLEVLVICCFDRYVFGSFKSVQWIWISLHTIASSFLVRSFTIMNSILTCASWGDTNLSHRMSMLDYF